MRNASQVPLPVPRAHKTNRSAICYVCYMAMALRPTAASQKRALRIAHRAGATGTRSGGRTHGHPHSLLFLYRLILLTPSMHYT